MGGTQPKLPHPGAVCVGFVWDMLTGGPKQEPSSSLSGVGTALPALGQDADPCHPTQPRQGNAASPPAQESDTDVTVAAGETAATTELSHVWPGPWLIKEGWTLVWQSRKEGWELNTIKLEPLWGLTGVGQPQEPS